VDSSAQERDSPRGRGFLSSKRKNFFSGAKTKFPVGETATLVKGKGKRAESGRLSNVKIKHRFG